MSESDGDIALRSIASVFVAVVLLWGTIYVTRPLDKLLLAVPGVLILPPIRRQVVLGIEAEYDREIPAVVRGVAVVGYGILTVSSILLMGGTAAEANGSMWGAVESWGVMVAFAAFIAVLVVNLGQSLREDIEES